MTTGSDSTIVVELTPPGRGAVAVVLLAGPRALEIARQFFAPVTPWPAEGPSTGRILLGRWSGADGEELVVCRRGVAEFEIHCHGGTASVSAVVRQLVAEGCCLLNWREWLRLSTGDAVSGTSASRRDAATVEARIALADAPTQRAAAVLIDQFHGALTREAQAARAAVSKGRGERGVEIIDRVLAFRGVGLHLTTPWRVVLAGRPNVGKSSLINAIAGFQRAIVSPTPGTTRDVVTVSTAIDGWPVQLEDTAGLRATPDELESAGVALARSAIESADLVLLVSDATQQDAAEAVVVDVNDLRRVILVWNKIDLVGATDRTRSEPHAVSAVTGEGIGELIAAIGKALVPHAPPAGAAVPFTQGQVAKLLAARAAASEGNSAGAEAALAALLACE